MIEDSGDAGAAGLWSRGAPAPSPLEAAEASELERRVATALAALPTIHREALLLAMEGIGPSEAAAVCGVSAAAMRQRLSRARAALDREMTATDAQRANGNAIASSGIIDASFLRDAGLEEQFKKNRETAQTVLGGVADRA